MTRSRISMIAAAAVVTVAGVALTAFAWPQEHGHGHGEGEHAHAHGEQGGQAGMDAFPDLIGGLKATPGCLGVDASDSMMSGKSVIFAWFENKKAAMRWYYSDMHQGAMHAFFPPRAEAAGDHKPMEGVPDDVPLLVIASITMSDKASFEETNLPISQIAIELYAPVSGGLYLGSRFAPDGVEVPDMSDYTPKR